MGKRNPTGDETGKLYAMFWRLMELSVHRYGSFPTGQLLTVLTIMLLDQADYHPTIGELAEITRLPKSTVSRYVSVEMSNGFLEEIIDPEDRRRRRIHPTRLARKEQQWHQQKVREIAELSVNALRGEGDSKQPAADLMKVLLGVGQSEFIRGANRGKKPIIPTHRG